MVLSNEPCVYAISHSVRMQHASTNPRYTVGSHPHEPHESRSIKIWSATFSKILQASELLGTNAIQFYMEKEAFDQILESGTSSPSLSLWGHLNSLIEAAGQFFLYWVIIQPVLVVCTLF